MQDQRFCSSPVVVALAVDGSDKGCLGGGVESILGKGQGTSYFTPSSEQSLSVKEVGGHYAGLTPAYVQQRGVWPWSVVPSEGAY